MSLRTLYKLPPSKSLQTDFAVLDVETAERVGYWKNRQFKNSKTYTGKLSWKMEATPRAFVFGVIHTRNKTIVCHSIDEMKHQLLHPDLKGKKVFAHNGGRFDFPCIYGNIYDTDPEALFDGKFISFTNGNCTFADSTNIFIGMSIAQIGKMLGMNKTGMSDNYGDSFWPRDYAADVNGCIRDCEILYDALVSTFEFAGSIKITQASLSMTYFRRNHQPYNIQFNDHVKEFYKSYYGGRTEVFVRGRRNDSVIDVNSMYPYWLINSKFPNPKFLRTDFRPTLETTNRILESYEGTITATVEHLPTDYPYLPHRSEGKLLFPVGVFRGQWAFPEFKFALEANIIRIKDVDSITYAPGMASPFVSFVETLFEIKLKATLSGDKWLVSMVKYYLNMLYGKFGQHIDEKTVYINDVSKCFEMIQEYKRTGQFKKLQMFSGKRSDAMLYIGDNKPQPSYAIPSFACYITANARVHLLKKILEMKPRGVSYCDTDSVFFANAVGVESSNDLGKWKLENKTVTHIYGLKNYRYIDQEKSPEEIFRSKGVPNTNFWQKDAAGNWVYKPKKFKIFSESEDTFNEVPTIERIDEHTFRYFNLMQTKEALRRGIEPGILTERTKKLTLNYDKRKVLPDGTTKPIEII